MAREAWVRYSPGPCRGGPVLRGIRTQFPSHLVQILKLDGLGLIGWAYRMVARWTSLPDELLRAGEEVAIVWTRG